MIEKYVVESQGSDGVWRPTPVLDLRLGELYLASNLHHANKSKIGQSSFNSAIDNRNIMPLETIQGWMLLGYPKGDFTERLRIRVAEADQSEYTKAITLPDGQTTPGFSAQTASVEIEPEEKDLSTFRKVISPETVR